VSRIAANGFVQFGPGGRHRYGLALVLLLFSLLYLMAIPEGDWARVIAMAFQAVALLAALYASDASRRLRAAIGLVYLVALVGGVVGSVYSSDPDGLVIRALNLAVLLIAMPAIVIGVVRQVRSAQQITIQTMFGVLCVFIVMTMSFAYTFAVVGAADDTPFFAQGAQWNQIGDYLYFSIITITTTGFGDLTPGTGLGRSLTSAEALIGQIYLVTVVAVIVSNLGRPRPARTGGKEDGDTERASHDG
jgi:voltage-gated potassium channel Kch